MNYFHQGDYDITCVRLFVRRFVSRITQKPLDRFPPNLAGGRDFVTFGADPEKNSGIFRCLVSVSTCVSIKRFYVHFEKYCIRNFMEIA